MRVPWVSAGVTAGALVFAGFEMGAAFTAFQMGMVLGIALWGSVLFWAFLAVLAIRRNDPAHMSATVAGTFAALAAALTGVVAGEVLLVTSLAAFVATYVAAKNALAQLLVLNA